MALGKKGLQSQLVESAAVARRHGEIGLLDLVRVRIVTRPIIWNREDVGDMVEQFVVEEAVKVGALPPAASNDPCAIDWSGLASFLEKIMPVILEFIKALVLLFG